MRPLKKAVSPVPAALYEADRLMSAIGPYCSLCERPIHDRPTLWNSEGDVVVQRVDHAPWESLLVLCVNCAEWQQQNARDPAELLLPHRETTMRVGRDSPYVYTLERVTLRIVDEDGAAEENEGEAAIVAGTTPAAASTIRRFRLNTPWYDEASKKMTVPRADHLKRTDRRVELRTQAWKRAEAVLPAALASRRDPGLASAFGAMRHLIEQTGFWSVWLSVFWRAIPDREALLPLFAPEARPERLHRAMVAGQAPPPPSAFVTLLHGTSTDFMD